MEKYFEDGLFSFPHVPENASGEVILGSLYRALELSPIKENQVGAEAKKFKKNVLRGYKKNNISSPSKLTDELFIHIIEKLIESPRLKNQNRRDVFFLSPLIPELASYGSVARYQGNPWNPGDYLIQMIFRGSQDGSDPKETISNLREALQVNPPKEEAQYADDIWSFFLQKEFEAWRSQDFPVINNNPQIKSKPRINFDNEFDFPARLFTKDIKILLELKGKLTRKRWIGILESYLRLIITLDVLWICHIQAVLLEIIKNQFSNESVDLDTAVIQEKFSKFQFFTITSKTKPVLSEFVSKYIKSSLILQEIKKILEEKACYPAIDFSIENILQFINSTKSNIAKNEFDKVIHKINEQLDANIGILYGGISSRSKNLSEFLNYVPARRATAIAVKSSYDQGYWYNKANPSRNAPWVFEPGPAALTALLQCCCESLGLDFVSIGDLIQFLATYGIKTNEVELSHGRSGQVLRGLGYIYDSPDAEGGIMIRKPY